MSKEGDDEEIAKKIRQAEEYKIAGNDCFQARDFKGALQNYHFVRLCFAE